MPTPTKRESLDTNLEGRYQKQRAGGAYDAKLIPHALADNLPNDFADGFTKGGQNTNLPKKDSLLKAGLSTKRYKG